MLPGGAGGVEGLDLALPLQPIEVGGVELGEGVLGHPVRLPGGELGDQGIGVRGHPHHHGAQAGGALEVAGHGLGHDPLPGNPLPHPERAHAEGVTVDVLLGEGGDPHAFDDGLQDVPGEGDAVAVQALVVVGVQHRPFLGSQVGEGGGRDPPVAVRRGVPGLVLVHEAHDHGVVVRGGDAGHLLHRGAGGHRVVRVHHQLPGEDHVVGRHRGAVAPAHVLAHGEGHLQTLICPLADVDGPPVVDGRGALRQVGHPVIAVVAPGQLGLAPEQVLDHGVDVGVTQEVAKRGGLLGHGQGDPPRRLRRGGRQHGGDRRPAPRPRHPPPLPQRRESTDPAASCPRQRRRAAP